MSLSARAKGSAATADAVSASADAVTMSLRTGSSFGRRGTRRGHRLLDPVLQGGGPRRRHRRVVREGAPRTPTAPRSTRERGGRALRTAIAAAGGLDDVAALSVGAQQHGMVCLDERRRGRATRAAVERHPLRARPPPTWSTSSAAPRRVGRGGRARCPSPRSRSPSCAGWPTHEPAHADATAAVCLPHDWLTWRLRGVDRLDDAAHRPRRRQRHRVLVAGDRRLPARPARAGARAGDPRCRACSARTRRRANGRRARARARRGRQRRRRAGSRRGPATASCRSVPPAVSCAVGEAAPLTPRDRRRLRRCHGAVPAAGLHAQRGAGAGRGRDHARRRLDELDRLALGAGRGRGPDARAVLRGRTHAEPPDAAGALHGVTTRNLTSANVARAAVEGLLASMAFCIDKIAGQGVDVDASSWSVVARARRPSGASPRRSGRPVHVPTPAEYVALGRPARRHGHSRRRIRRRHGRSARPPPIPARPTPRVLDAVSGRPVVDVGSVNFAWERFG